MKAIYNTLVVDDDDNIRELIVEGLADYPKRVFEARDGNEALEIVKNNIVDIVFSDVKMPGLDGIELLKSLREDENEVVFVLVTSFSDKEVATSALKWGAYDIIEKPFKNDELIGTFMRAATKCSYEFENQRLIDEFVQGKLGDKSPDALDPAELKRLREISKSIIELRRIKYGRKG